MTGSALMDFLITIVVVLGIGALFFVTIDRLAPDALLNKIAKIAVGVVLAVVLLLAVKGVLFGGGAMVASASGVIGFAIGVVVIIVVLFLVDKALGYLLGMIGQTAVDIIRYVIFAVALIALLIVADQSLFGGSHTGRYIDLGSTPSIMKPERR